MFICRPCAEKNDVKTDDAKLIVVVFRSKGNCEVCGFTEVCADVHHSLLPRRMKAADAQGN